MEVMKRVTEKESIKTTFTTATDDDRDKQHPGETRFKNVTGNMNQTTMNWTDEFGNFTNSTDTTVFLFSYWVSSFYFIILGTLLGGFPVFICFYVLVKTLLHKPTVAPQAEGTKLRTVRMGQGGCL
jgi:hypothetical protein